MQNQRALCSVASPSPMNGERVEEECWVLLSQSLRNREKKSRSLTLRIAGFDEARGCLLHWRACIRLRDLGDAILLTLQHVRVRAVFVEGSVVYRECAQGREGGIEICRYGLWSQYQNHPRFEKACRE